MSPRQLPEEDLPVEHKGPTRKAYVGDEVIVSFDGQVCEHAAECVKGAPSVFDTHRRPWIDPDGAPADTVIEVVGRCPSGALRVSRIG